MATTWYACPNCGQQQKAEHAPGEEVRPQLCAACAEEKEITQELESAGVLPKEKEGKESKKAAR